MKDSVRQYLEKFEQASKDVIATEEKLYAHDIEVTRTIEHIKKEGQKKATPILEELVGKKRERQKYDDMLNGKLTVNLQELIREFDQFARADWYDKATSKVAISAQAGVVDMAGLKAKIKNKASDLRNALTITIKNSQYDIDHKFFIYKSMPLNEDIKFSDGSSLFDNLILTHKKDNFGREVTEIDLTENGKQNIMITFSPEDLINKTYFMRPVGLLRACVLNILEKNHTM